MIRPLSTVHRSITNQSGAGTRNARRFYMAMVVALNWPALAVRGVVAILFGLIAFFMPGATLFALTVLFGAYAFIDGIAGLTAAFRSARHGEHWWEFLIEGLFGLGAAVVTLLWPALTLTVLIYIV